MVFNIDKVRVGRGAGKRALLMERGQTVENIKDAAP